MQSIFLISSPNTIKIKRNTMTKYYVLKTFLVILCLTSVLMIANSEWQVTENLLVCAAKNAQHFPVLISDGKNGVIVAWRDAQKGNYDVFAQRISETGEILWDVNGVAVCDHNSSQSAPVIVSDSKGGAIVVWGDTRNGSQDSFAQRIDSNGKKLWQENGVSVCTDPTLQDDFSAIADGNGGVIIVWEDWRSGNQDIYTQKISADGQPIWNQNGIPVFDAKGDQYDPTIVSDGEGGAIFVWWDISTPDWDILAQRIDSKGNAVWETPIPVCSAKGNQGGPTIVTDGHGGVFCVWPDYRNDPNFLTTAQLYAQHIDANGKALWQKDGIPICNVKANQQQQDCISDGDGGFIVVWWDDRDIFADIYAQRINVDGILQWNKTGVHVCTAGGVQQNPKLVSDGSEGTIIYWLDYRQDFVNSTEDAIYAQRIDANGLPLWQKDGVPVCNADKQQISPMAVATRNGSAIVVWSDARGKDHDIYLQRIQ